MASNGENIIGIAMQLDVSDLRAGLQETRKAITTANKEFNAATSGMDDWSKSSEGLNEKLKQLDTVLTMQKKAVAGIEAEMKRLRDENKENTEEYRRLNDKLLDAKASVGKTEKQIRNYTKKLEDVEQGTSEVKKETDRMGNSMRDAKNDVSKLDGGFTVLKGTMSNLVSSGIQSIIGGLKSAVTESQQLRTELGRLETSFLDSGHTSEQASQSFVELNSVLGDSGRTTEALQQLGTLADNQKELSEYTNILTGVYAKFGDSLPVEGLAEAMNHTAKLGKVQGTLADALEWVGLTVEDFDEKLEKCSSEEERAKLIRETLTEKYDEASETYKELNKDLIDAQRSESEFALAQAEAGEKIQPIQTAIRDGFTELLDAFVEMTEGIDMKAIADAITEGFGWLVDNKDAILGVITGVGTAFATWKVVGLIQALIGATEGLTLAQALLNLVMSANPIGLIVGLIAGLVAAFITLWHTSDDFRNFWINLWENIKKVAIDCWNYIKKAFSDAWKNIKKLWGEAKAFFVGIWNSIKNTFKNVGSTIGGFFSSAWSNIKKTWSNVTGWFEDIYNDIVGFFDDLPDKMLEIGVDMMNGLIEGINSMIDSIGESIGNVSDSVIGWFEDTFDINSPSKVMRDRVGMMLGAGVGEGILASSKDVLKDTKKFNNIVLSGLSGSVPQLAGSIPASGGAVTNVTNHYVQTINAPKQLSRLEIYRQSKNLLALKGGY